MAIACRHNISSLDSPLFFFFNDTATTEIYTLSLHDALPIWADRPPVRRRLAGRLSGPGGDLDRKSTRLNSSHGSISYAVFCLKKNKEHRHHAPRTGRPRGARRAHPRPAAP